MDKISEGARSTMRLDSESDFEQGMTKLTLKKSFGGYTTWIEGEIEPGEQLEDGWRI